MQYTFDLLRDGRNRLGFDSYPRHNKGNTNNHLEGQTEFSHSFKHLVLLHTNNVGACLLVQLSPVVVTRSYIFKLR
jgi:hypothetical protein